jgi:hypothetical protein
MTLADIIEMAEMCAYNARSTLDPRTSEEVWKMALEYQRMAAELDGGNKPDIGGPPRTLIARAIIAGWNSLPRR